MTCYEEGRIAYQEGRDVCACPYFDQPRREAWLNGWYETERDFKDA